MGAAYGVIVTILIEPRVIPHFLDQLTRLPFKSIFLRKAQYGLFFFSHLFIKINSQIFF